MVLYPVFVHMYLELVYNNHETEGNQYFNVSVYSKGSFDFAVN